MPFFGYGQSFRSVTFIVTAKAVKDRNLDWIMFTISAILKSVVKVGRSKYLR